MGIGEGWIFKRLERFSAMLHISRGIGMLFCSGNSLACSKSKLFSHILRCQTFCFPKGKTDEEGWIFKRLDRFSATSYVFWFARIAALKQFLYNICMEYCVFSEYCRSCSTDNGVVSQTPGLRLSFRPSCFRLLLSLSCQKHNLYLLDHIPTPALASVLATLIARTGSSGYVCQQKTKGTWNMGQPRTMCEHHQQ